MMNQVRSSFLKFFESRGHAIYPSSSLIPHNDPSLLFTNSGMVQFKDYFTGLQKPKDKKISTSQKSLRAGGKHNDLENVGYTNRHHTFFEMLGNFSFGDYFKEDAIKYAYDFLVKEINLDQNKLYFTVFHNDDEAFAIWKKVAGCADDRIIRISSNDNFWMMGDTGPCGPCSEIFYDYGEGLYGGLPGTPEQDGPRYTEIWNLVFMQYEKFADGSQKELPNKCIDTGMGLERILSVLEGKTNNYETSFFTNLISQISKILEIKVDEVNKFSFRVIADHIRAINFLIADGVLPSNEGRGYVLRRIIRRALRHIYMLNVKKPVLRNIGSLLIDLMGETYNELIRARQLILQTLTIEEENFTDLFARGIKLLDNIENTKVLSGEIAFKLYDTFGFPLDLTQDILKPKNITVDTLGFETEMQKQKDRSRKNWVGSGELKDDQVWFNLSQKHNKTTFVGYNTSEITASVLECVPVGEGKFGVVLNVSPFYAESGGQVGDTGFLDDIEVIDTQKHADFIVHYTKQPIEINRSVNAKIDTDKRNKIKANHTATHLLHHVLRNKFGEGVVQKGSLVNATKLRFDFSIPFGLNRKQISDIEQDINKLICENHPVSTQLKKQDEAIKSGAIALFGEKYEDIVRVVSSGKSIEFCGGTHLDSTGQIGLFKIVSESSVASGIRRIEALTGNAALEYVQQMENEYLQILNENKLKKEENALCEYIKALKLKVKDGEQEVLNIKTCLLNGIKPRRINDFDFVYIKSGFSLKDLTKINPVPTKTTFYLCKDGDKIAISCRAVGQDDANALLQGLQSQLGEIKGGGGKSFASGITNYTKQKLIKDLQADC